MVLEQKRETGSHTCMTFLCLSKDRKDTTACKEAPAQESALPRSSSQIAVPSPSSCASGGSRCSSLTQGRRTWSISCEAGELTCTKPCFSLNQGKNRSWPQFCTWSSQIPIIEAMALGGGGWTAESESWSSFHTSLPWHPYLVLVLFAYSCWSRRQAPSSPNLCVVVLAATGLVFRMFNIESV